MLLAMLVLFFSLPAYAEEAGTEQPQQTMQGDMPVLIRIYPEQIHDSVIVPDSPPSSEPYVNRIRELIRTGDSATVAILVLLGVASACLVGAACFEVKGRKRGAHHHDD